MSNERELAMETLVHRGYEARFDTLEKNQSRQQATLEAMKSTVDAIHANTETFPVVKARVRKLENQRNYVIGAGSLLALLLKFFPWLYSLFHGSQR